MHKTPQQKISLTIIVISIIVPFLIMTQNLLAGVSLLLLGLIIARRALMVFNENNTQSISDKEVMKHDRQQNERSRTSFVQVVDDNGYDLPPSVVEQKMREAQLHAGPRDTVIAVRHKIN